MNRDDILRMIPVKWKTGLRVGPEHMLHMDERARALGELWARMPRRARGLLDHSLPAGSHRPLVNVTKRVVTGDVAEVTLEIGADFAALSRSGSLILGVTGLDAQPGGLITDVPLRKKSTELTAGAKWDKRYVVLVKSGTNRSERPAGLATESAGPAVALKSGDRVLEVAYPGLSIADPCPEFETMDEPEYDDYFPIARFRVIDREVMLEEDWIPPLALVGTGTRISSAPIDAFRRVYTLVRERLTVLTRPHGRDWKYGSRYLATTLALGELGQLWTRTDTLCDAVLEESSVKELRNDFILPLERWLCCSRKALLSATPKPIPVLGGGGTSDLLDHGRECMELVLNDLGHVGSG